MKNGITYVRKGDYLYPALVYTISDRPIGIWGIRRKDYHFICDYLQPALDFMDKHPDKILWCGEFGTIRHADIRWRENWMRDMISSLTFHSIPYCVWNYLSIPV